MSVESEALKATRQRAGKAEIFTEVDVALDVARGKNYGSNQRAMALRQANKILSQQYRNGKLARFGPVPFMEGLDYARLASRIVYCGLEDGEPRVPVWETPNGAFKAILYHAAPAALKRTGRLPGNDRDDSEPWASQDISVTRRQTDPVERKGKGPEVVANPVLALTQQRDRLQAQVQELENKLSNGDPSAIKAQIENIVLDLVGDIERRISTLEEREALRERIYTRS